MYSGYEGLYEAMVERRIPPLDAFIVNAQRGISLSAIKAGHPYVVHPVLVLFGTIQDKSYLKTVSDTELSIYIEAGNYDSENDAFFAKYFTWGYMYALLRDSLFYVYDVEKDALALHVGGIDTLSYLNRCDLLEAPKGKVLSDEFKRYEKHFSNPYSVFPQNDCVKTVRLELQPSGKFSVTIPRSAVNFKESPIFTFLQLLNELKMFKTLAGGQILKIEMGDKVRYVTTDKGLLRMVYSSERVDSLYKSAVTTPMGSTSMYLPSVGASAYSFGLTRLDLLTLDRVSAGNLEEIDLSNVNVNFDKVKPFLLSKLNSQNLMKFTSALNILTELLAGKSNAEVKELVVATISRGYDADLFESMKALGYSAKDLEEFSTPVGDCYTEVAIPSSANALRARLDTGVYKIIFTKRDGRMGTIIGTNCAKYLRETLGGGYFKKFESEGVRLSALMKKVMKEETINIDALAKSCEETYGLPIVASEIRGTFVLSDTASVEEVTAIIEKYMSGVESRKTSKPNPDNVLIRNCFATLEGGVSNNFYRNVDFKMIRQIYKLSKD